MSLAPAVTRDGFSYAGDLFAETSGHNRHRRATVTELKDHFKSGNEKDHPAHWFEAQLIHYGLPPSKTKAVARMRLFDAVNRGNLSIPAHIKKLESELKKEWTKNERDAKKSLMGTSSAATKSTKRKAESSTVDLTVDVGGVNITVSASSSAKRAKTTARKPATPSKAPKKVSAPKTTATAPKLPPIIGQKLAFKSPSHGSTAAPSFSAPAPPRTNLTARRGGARQGPGRGSATAVAPASSPIKPRQTARRGRPFAPMSRGSGAIRSSPIRIDEEDDDDPPPPYREFLDEDDSSDGYSYGRGRNNFDDDDDDSGRDSYKNNDTELRPLGLLNGRYDIESPFVTEEWGHTDFSLILTLVGTELWGRFDLGVISGVLRLPQRPWVSSHEDHVFRWRGCELDGEIMYRDGQEGSIRFLGDGRVEGEIDFMDIKFRGDRRGGQGTRSEVDGSTLRNEWDGYSEAEYERQNRARWH